MRNTSGIVVPSAVVTADPCGDLGYACGFSISADETIAIVAGDMGGLHRVMDPLNRMARAEQLILPGKLATAFPHGLGTQNNAAYDAVITPDGNRAMTILGGRLYRLDNLRTAHVEDIVWTHIAGFPYDASLTANDQEFDERRQRRKLRFDPVNTDVMWVATKTKLRVSTNAGATLPEVAHMLAPTGATLLQMVDFDRLGPVIGGRTARVAVAVAGRGVYVTQTGNEADLTLIYSAATTFFDVFWDTEVAGKLWILTGLAHPNVRSWTAAGGVVTETKFPRQIRQLIIRRGVPAEQLAFTADGKPMHTANDWGTHRWWQGANDVRGVTSRSPIAGARLTGLLPGWPSYSTLDGQEVHFTTGLGHCFTRWSAIPAATGSTRALQFPVWESTWTINRLVAWGSEWLSNGMVAYLSHDVQLIVGSPEASFASIMNPSTSLGFGYDIDWAIDDPDWHAFYLASTRSGFFDINAIEASWTTWTNTPALLAGGMAVRNKGEVTIFDNSRNWPVQSVNAHTATPTWQDCTFTGLAKPSYPLPVGHPGPGFGFSGDSNVRHIITCNKLTGERWCWNYIEPQWGIWRSPDASAPFVKVKDGSIVPRLQPVNVAAFGAWSAQLKFAPGTHDLYLTARGGGLTPPGSTDQTNRIMVSRNASAFAGTLADFVDTAGICNPAAMCFGAPMPGHTYPMLWAVANRDGDLALGIHGSPDGGLTWPVFWPWPYPTTCNAIAAKPADPADPSRNFGQLIISLHGWGHRWLDLSKRSNRRR